MCGEANMSVIFYIIATAHIIGLIQRAHRWARTGSKSDSMIGLLHIVGFQVMLIAAWYFGGLA